MKQARSFHKAKARSNWTSTEMSRTELTFKLTYSGMSSPVTQAHVHFGRVHVAGGIIAFFCSNLANSPPEPRLARRTAEP